MYQQTTIVGNVGSVELRYTSSGVPVFTFSVAVNKQWRDKNTNEQRKVTTWFKCVAWRALADICHQHVTKGMRILVVGEIEASAYVAQDGEARANLELTAREVKFLTWRDEIREQQSNDEAFDYDHDENDDVPF